MISHSYLDMGTGCHDIGIMHAVKALLGTLMRSHAALVDLRRSLLMAAALSLWILSTDVLAADTSVILAGRLILADQGKVAFNQKIVVTDGLIIAVGDSIATPPGAKVIDLTSMTVLPGFIDCHTHLTIPWPIKDLSEELKRSPATAAFQSISNARMKLLSGFTTVRDAGSYWAFVDVALRDAIARREVVGPRMLVAGAMITMTGGAGALTGLTPEITLPRELRYGEANNPAEVRQRIRDVRGHGADIIKIFASGAVMQHGHTPSATEFTAEELGAAVDEATHLGMKVMAHAHSAAGIKNAVHAGVASIEHGSLLDDEGIVLMKKKGTYFVPTLSVHECLDASGAPADFLEKAHSVARSHREAFQRALKAGVKIALGSDSVVCPHDKGAREFHYMVELGMQPMRAIQAGTVDAADLLGLSDVGSIAVGKKADIVAVRGDPLSQIDFLGDVAFVMKDGDVYKTTTP